MNNQYRSPVDEKGSEKGGSNYKRIETGSNVKPDMGGLTGFSLAEIIGKGAGKLVFGESKDRELVEQWITDRKAENRSEPLVDNPLKNSSSSGHARIYFRRTKELFHQAMRKFFRKEFFSLYYF